MKSTLSITVLHECVNASYIFGQIVCEVVLLMMCRPSYYPVLFSFC